MANKKISALTAATTPDGTELVPIVQGGTTKKATVSQLTGATVSVGLNLTPTAVKTGAYNAAAGDLVPVDTTSGSVTVTLPTAPADKTTIGIKHVTRGGTNTVTYAAGGSDVMNKAGGSTSGTLTLLSQAALLQYNAAGGIWYVIADDVPLSQLDLRFVALTNEGGIVSNSESDTTISNDNTEQTLSTRATPTAPALAAGDRLVFRCSGEMTNSTGGNVGLTLRFKLGSTTVFASASTAVSTGSNPRKWYLEVVIALTSVNAQVIGAIMSLSSGGNTGMVLSTTNLCGAAVGVAAEDLSSSKNCVLTAQMDTASASASITKHSASIERIAKVA